MQKYKEFQPTCFDSKGAFLPDRKEWLVIPVGRNRDSGPLANSNFFTALELLNNERNNIVEVHRFGHWGPGWFEIIIINPKAGKTLKIAESIKRSLEDYPVLDEMDFYERELEEANEIWANCYNWGERIDYIRENRSQFEFDSFAEMLEVVRGKYFIGYASELIR